MFTSNRYPDGITSNRYIDRIVISDPFAYGIITSNRYPDRIKLYSYPDSLITSNRCPDIIIIPYRFSEQNSCLILTEKLRRMVIRTE